jgi:hypothetical protein
MSRASISLYMRNVVSGVRSSCVTADVKWRWRVASRWLARKAHVAAAKANSASTHVLIVVARSSPSSPRTRGDGVATSRAGSPTRRAPSADASALAPSPAPSPSSGASDASTNRSSTSARSTGASVPQSTRSVCSKRGAEGVARQRTNATSRPPSGRVSHPAITLPARVGANPASTPSATFAVFERLWMLERCAYS